VGRGAGAHPAQRVHELLAALGQREVGRHGDQHLGRARRAHARLLLVRDLVAVLVVLRVARRRSDMPRAASSRRRRSSRRRAGVGASAQRDRSRACRQRRRRRGGGLQPRHCGWHRGAGRLAWVAGAAPLPALPPGQIPPGGSHGPVSRAARPGRPAARRNARAPGGLSPGVMFALLLCHTFLLSSLPTYPTLPSSTPRLLKSQHGGSARGRGRGRHLHQVGGLVLRDGQAAHGAVHGVGLVVEVLHAPQRRARQAALVADAAAVVADLLRERQEQRLVAQAVQVLVRVRVDDLRARGRSDPGLGKVSRPSAAAAAYARRAGSFAIMTAARGK